MPTTDIALRRRTNRVTSDQAAGRALRILALCHEYPPVGGGAAAVCAALSREYVRQHAQVTVVTMAYGDLPAREQQGAVEVFRVECGRRRKEMASAWEGLRWANRAWRLVRDQHRRSPWDAAHAHFIMPAGIIASRLQRSFGVPFIVTPHGSDVPGYNRERLKLVHRMVRPWWKRICRQADQVVSPSASLMELIQRRVAGIRSDVIPNGFLPGRFRPLEKERRILLCSRLVERKGFQYFLQAIAPLDLAGWEVDIVGDGPYRENLEQMASSSRTPITFHGWLDNGDPRLAQLYGRAMIFAFPSEWENFSIALLEGMSAGCAVITTNISGNPEAIGETGRLIAPGDVAALRQSVLELTADQRRCRELGAAAARRAAECFDWQVLGARYFELLRSRTMRSIP